MNVPRLEFEILRQGMPDGTNHVIVSGRWWVDDEEFGVQQEVSSTKTPSSYDTDWESIMFVSVFQKVHNEYMKWLKKQGYTK